MQPFRDFRQSPHDDPLLPLGVSARTGHPLHGLSDDAIAASLGRPEPAIAQVALGGRADPAAVSFAIEGSYDASDLGQAGWGVIFAPGVDQQIKDALQPLLDRRRSQGADPFVVFDGPTGYQPGDTATAWLARQGVRPDVVDPAQGVPFYLLLVGSAEDLPFTFQYGLDLYWGCGRLWFPSADQFRAYAESVIAYETAPAVPTSRQVAVFAPRHGFDAATGLFNSQVALPLINGDGRKPIPLGSRQSFAMRDFTGDAATRQALHDIFTGTMAGGSPALLFSGGHGMQFDLGDARQADAQGALVCQDWPGYGAIAPDHWFAGADVPAAAKVHGLVHVLFACHGGGCTSHDEFDRLGAAPRQIAERPFFARLPQALLAHREGGALAVLAHIERAWAYAFQSAGGEGQIQGFRDVAGRLLRGERIGQATDMFNIRWAALSTELAEMQADAGRGIDVPLATLGRLWVARDDARNFMVFGDPAVRLRVEDMPAVS